MLRTQMIMLLTRLSFYTQNASQYIMRTFQILEAHAINLGVRKNHILLAFDLFTQSTYTKVS
jgi:hypothetical protein